MHYLIRQIRSRKCTSGNVGLILSCQVKLESPQVIILVKSNHFYMLKLADYNTSRNSQALRKSLDRCLVAFPHLQELAHPTRGYQHSGGKFICLPFLFFGPCSIRIINENSSLTMKNDMSNFVEERVPELIVALIAATQLDQSLVWS